MAGKREFDPVAVFFAKAAEAVADIRHKLVEEPWFGREVTPDQPASVSDQLGWTKPEPTAWDRLCTRVLADRGHEDPVEPAHDHEIER
jgi:hypothetical protein